jgi:S1-C subfamily serine protease
MHPRRVNFAALAALSLSLHSHPGWTRADSRNLPVGSASSLIEAADTLELAGLQKQFEGIAHRISPAVVAISAAADGGLDDGLMRNENLTPQKLDSMLSRTTRTVGTGLFIDQNGFIVTNEHVVAESAELWVTTDDGKVFPAVVIGSDPRSDLAVLKIPADNTATVNFAMDKSVQRGDWAIALGNPYGLACEGGVAMSVGVVSALDRSLPRLSSKEDRLYSGLIQTTAQINPGSSGGPLLDLNGEVIGINTAVILPHKSANGIGFAIPVTPELMRELDVLRQGGEVVYGDVGLTVRQPTPRELKAAGVSGGARVESIENESPAAGSGIRNNDLVVAINGSVVRNADHFIRLVGTMQVDQCGSISVSRGGKTVDIAVTPRKRQVQAASVNKWTQRLRWHGMTLGPIPSNWSARHGDHAVAGIYVVGVDNPDRCAVFGVKQGSIIRAVAGKSVRSIADLQTVIDATPPDAVRVEVMDETAVAAIKPAP